MSDSLKPGDALDLEIEKGVYRGLGLGRHHGQVVLVPRALPGDRLRVDVETAHGGFVRGRAVAVLEPSPARRPAPCPLAERCGGCAYQQLAYPEQLVLKREVVRESLARAGVPWPGRIEVAGSPEQGWRTRASLHLEERDGEWRLGLHEEGTHRVVDLTTCLQLSEAMVRTARAVLGAVRERPHWGRALRGVELAESLDGRELVACLDTTMELRQASSLSALGRAIPWVRGLGALARAGGRRRFVLLAGDPHVHSRIAGIGLRAHVRSFFQANRFLVEPLVEAVREEVPPGGTVLDLYGGVGLFALPLARRAEAVRVAELNATAVEDCRFNAQQAGLAKVEAFRGDVLAALAAWGIAPGERIVLDPPRSGAGAEVVRAVARRRPETVVYVSCDPPTLGRDLKLFEGEGYRPERVRALDLFPDTFHVETLVRLTRPA